MLKQRMPPHNLGRVKHEPTQSEIREACIEIQAEWSEDEKLLRARRIPFHERQRPRDREPELIRVRKVVRIPHAILADVVSRSESE
jgi:hypothetical protein